MVLTDVGSGRVGIQEYVELRRQQTTVKITNGMHYYAENQEKILRRTKVNKLAGHRRMYLEIGRDIGKGKLCDSAEQIRLTHGAMIELETLLIMNQD